MLIMYCSQNYNLKNLLLFLRPWFFVISDVQGLQITDLTVPRSVRNGSDYVILDCQYALLPDDLKPDSGLVVKWFYNSIPSPIYQWIPGELLQPPGRKP